MDEDRKSRTQKKNEDRDLQKLGERLVTLSREQLEGMDMPDELLEAVMLARGIKSHGARRRQLQYIGKLMRNIDSESIRNTVDNIRLGDAHKAWAFKKIERWRDELKKGNDLIIEEILGTCPAGERQRLAQLARNAHKEYEAGKGVKASRVLFRYLRQISEDV